MEKPAIRYFLLAFLFYLICPIMAIAPLLLLYRKGNIAKHAVMAMLFFSAITLIITIMQIVFAPYQMTQTLLTAGESILMYGVLAVAFSIMFDYILKSFFLKEIALKIIIGSIGYFLFLSLIVFLMGKETYFSIDISKAFTYLEKVGYSLNVINEMKATFEFLVFDLLPKSISIISLFSSLFVFQHYSFYLNREDDTSTQSIATIRLPKLFFWITVAVLYIFIIVVILLKIKNSLGLILIYNAMLFFAGIIAIYGYGIVIFFAKKWNIAHFFKSPLAIVALCLLFFMNILFTVVIGGLFLFMIGFLDVFFNFRKLDIKKDM